MSADPLVFHRSFFRCRPFTFILIGWTILPLLYWYFLSKSEKIVIANGEVRYNKGLISKDETEAKLATLRTVKIKQGIIDRIFGCGDIEIYTAGDNPEIVAKGFSNPNVIKNALKGRDAGVS